MKKDEPKVSIIILNWNGWHDTIECLESVYSINYTNYEVILVDNNSQGQDIEKIKQWAKGKIHVSSKFIKNPAKKPVKYFYYTKKEFESRKFLLDKKRINRLASSSKLIILKNNKNQGFAEGNNIPLKRLIKEGKSRYALLLNNDTAVDKNFLREMVKAGEKEDDVALVSPKIYYYKHPKKIWFYGGFINWNVYPGYHHHKKGNNSELANHEWASGTCMLIKLERRTSLLDNHYYFGCEDIAYSQKIVNEGKKIRIPKNAKIWHKISRSRGYTPKSIIRAIKTNHQFLKNNGKSYSKMLLPTIAFYIKELLINNY
jgi:GT2 family glycosyltransferase